MIYIVYNLKRFDRLFEYLNEYFSKSYCNPVKSKLNYKIKDRIKTALVILSLKKTDLLS